jgi:hypothetical protein
MSLAGNTEFWSRNLDINGANISAKIFEGDKQTLVLRMPKV